MKNFDIATGWFEKGKKQKGDAGQVVGIPLTGFSNKKYRNISLYEGVHSYAVHPRPNEPTPSAVMARFAPGQILARTTARSSSRLDSSPLAKA